MTAEESEAFVRSCAHGLNAMSPKHLPPASIRAITVQCVGPSTVVVWIITALVGMSGPSFRMTFSRLAGGVVSTDSLSVVSNSGIKDASFWDIPGNVRDLGITAGWRALGL